MMSLPTIFLIALSLSLDAFAVSIASGIIIHKQKIQNAVRLSFCFAFFQMMMPELGWWGGRLFIAFLENTAHWVAFILLFLIGGKMIYEATKMESIESVPAKISLTVLIVLGIATSMDALAVGFSLCCLKVSILQPVIIIGIVTFIMSFLGFFIGDKFGHIFEKKVEIIAGLLLIAIGIKILISHL